MRPTRDLDVIAVVQDRRFVRVDDLPAPLAQAAADVAATFGLAEDWLNPGPASLLELGLPKGFVERTETRTYGALVLHVASRIDQICFKLYASGDMGPDSKHVRDLERLEPTTEELLAAARWAVTHDPSPAFRGMLVKALAYFGIEDAEARL